MSLKDTSLILEVAPLPTTFVGTPNDLVAELVKRARIVSPNGANFIFIGDIQPTTNVGPWLKGGTQWYVWSDVQNTYVPADISASFTIPFFIGNATPVGNNPPLWLQTTNNSTDQNPNGFGTPLAWYFWNGSGWQPFNSVPQSGSTVNRPTAPINFQQYFDTDINLLIHWERGAWRTVAGSPGDLKYVNYLTQADAVKFNPGWAVFGESQTSVRGRGLTMATQDAGAAPAYVLTPPSGVPVRAAGDEFGENIELQLSNASNVFQPPRLAAWLLVKQ